MGNVYRESLTHRQLLQLLQNEYKEKIAPFAVGPDNELSTEETRKLFDMTALWLIRDTITRTGQLLKTGYEQGVELEAYEAVNLLFSRVYEAHSVAVAKGNVKEKRDRGPQRTVTARDYQNSEVNQ